MLTNSTRLAGQQVRAPTLSSSPALGLLVHTIMFGFLRCGFWRLTLGPDTWIRMGQGIAAVDVRAGRQLPTSEPIRNPGEGKAVEYYFKVCYFCLCCGTFV